MNRVFVVDRNKQPLMPCHPARARELLKMGRAAVFRHEPFTIILKDRVGGEVQATELKIDPGSQTTGIALVLTGKRSKRVIWAAELNHRGTSVTSALNTRRAQRNNRRYRKTRYRASRFMNRRQPKGWIAPSLRSRINNIVTWVNRIKRLCCITEIVQELARFDTQLMENPEIEGITYQQGTLVGYEVRQYLLEKYQRTCVYCSKTDVPLEIDHIVPRSRGGSDRVSNLTLACHRCNQKKGNQTAEEFGYPHLQVQANHTLKDAAVVNITRWVLYECLCTIGLPVTISTGGRTQFNRTRQSYPKTHWLDAACVGLSGINVYVDPDHIPLCIQATGRQSRQMTLVDKYGFPRSTSKGIRLVHGFQTGDLVQAVVPNGKRTGTHRGRVAVKGNGRFTIKGTPDISWRYCHKIQCADGYAYTTGKRAGFASE